MLEHYSHHPIALTPALTNHVGMPETSFVPLKVRSSWTANYNCLQLYINCILRLDRSWEWRARLGGLQFWSNS